MNNDLAFYGELLGDIKIRIRQSQTRALPATEKAPIAQIPWAHKS